jgi:hypothetical protein
MLNTISRIAQAILPSEFALENLPNFPFAEWEEQKTEYEEMERWFNSSALADQPTSPGKKVDLYPMRVNPIPSAVQKHAYILFGEVEDDARSLVVPKIIPPSRDQKLAAQAAEEVINTIWWESSGRAIMIENALISQVYGGCVFKLTYVPWDVPKYRTFPFIIEVIHPKEFIGYPIGRDYFRLSEAWVVREIYGREAVKWGYTASDPDETVYYTEHWTEDNYEVRVNGQIASKRFNDGRVEALTGENPFFQPTFVYIPHIRIGHFRGNNLFDHLKGYIQELNLRWGDWGDAANDDSHVLYVGKDMSGSPQFKRVNEWFEYLDIGATQSYSGNEKPPDMSPANINRSGSTAMDKLIGEIYNQWRRDAFIPPVSEGEDEGSQRSAMTLAMRFWPLTSHVNIERYSWTAALDMLDRLMLKACLLKGVGNITEAQTKMRIKHKWSPQLPRDREADAQEWVARSGQNLGSMYHLLELTGDVEDTDEEADRILEWIERVEDAKAKVASKYALTELEKEQEGDLETAKVQAETFAAQRAASPPSGGNSKGGAK